MTMNFNWSPEQLSYINKLEAVDRTFEEILKLDSDCLVISDDEKDKNKNYLTKLRTLRKQVRSICAKLKEQRFAVAVVGLEKAGKSTLANSLIKKNILPNERERCTFAKTTVRYGQEDKVTVAFYTFDEFNNIFKEMLKTVKFNEGKLDGLSFDSLSAADFDAYWQTVKETDEVFYNTHDNRTAADIRTVLLHKDEIQECLRQNRVLEFDFDDRKAYEVYITGVQEGDRDEFGAIRRRSSKPYAVKEITVVSSRLNDMENIVLYDVPGFDSTTNIHEDQTVGAMKDADAVIFVCNAGKPSFTSPQLNIFNKYVDDDGLSLKQKTLVFGSYADKLDNKADYQQCASAVRRECATYRIADEDNIIFGSAYAHLVRLGAIDPNDQPPVDASGKIELEKDQSADSAAVTAESLEDKLNSFGIDDGIERLTDKLEEAYRNRFPIIQRRAQNRLTEARKVLEAIQKANPIDKLETLPGDMQLGLKARDAIRELFVSEAKSINLRWNEKINSERPFSEAIKKVVDEIYPEASESNATLKKIEGGEAVTNGNVYNVVNIDTSWRDKLYAEFVSNFIRRVASEIGGRQQEIRDELVEAFLKALGCSYADANLKESVNELFNRMLIKDGDKCHFNSLIERFAYTPVEVLIRYRYLSDERFKAAVLDSGNYNELKFLQTFYEKPGQKEDASKLDGDILFKILFHAGDLTEDMLDASEEDAPKSSVSESANNRKLQALLNDTEKVRRGSAQCLLNKPNLIAQYAKLISEYNIDLEKTEKYSLLAEAVNEECAKPKFLEGVEELKLAVWEYLINNFCRKNYIRVSESEFNMLDRVYRKAAAEHKSMSTKADMIKVLNEDIKSLREITKDCIIEVIGLERAFTSVITKNINIIRGVAESSRDDVPSANREYNEWLVQNLRRIKAAEYADLEREANRNATRKGIVESIGRCLAELRI